MNKQITIIAVAVFSIVLLLGMDYQRAYAIAGFQTQTVVTISGASNDLCTGIAMLPSTHYVIMVCQTSTNLTIRASTISGTAIASTGFANTVSNNGILRADCVAIDSVTAVCSIGTVLSGQPSLRKITVTSSSTISIVNYIPSSTASSVTFLGGSAYHFQHTDGLFVRVGLSSMAQTGSWSGIETGSCTNVDLITAITPNIGFAICDSTEGYLFTFSGSSGSVSKSAPITLTNSYSIGEFHAVYSNGKIYLSGDNQQIESIPVDLSTATFTGASVEFSPSADDIKSVIGGYLVVVDSVTDQYYLIAKSGNPPNNIEFTGALTTGIADGARMYSPDSSNFVISKGSTAGDVYFIYGTQLRNAQDIPIAQETEKVNR